MTTSLCKLLLLIASLRPHSVLSATTLLHHPRRRQLGSSSPTNLTSCLLAIPGDPVVVVPDDSSYSDAMHCHNSGRSDRTWSPRAVMKVTTADQVAAAVQCASLSDITVTARSGAHGFENEACSGELIVDVSNLDSLVVDTDAKVVEFGAGHLHGQLYRKLIDYGLVVPGGTENSVGTAGLWLGCGRGILTQVYGLSCDNVLGIEFVDSNGNLRVANSTTNTDMFFMARGAGGEFPGVVTKFIAQAYDMPTEVYEVSNSFPSDQVKPLIKAWAARIDELSDPSLSMFTYIHAYMGTPVLSMTCYSCTEAQKEYLMTQMEEISNVAGGGFGLTFWTGTWLDRLLKEDWDDYENESDLMQQAEWPAVWETMANGGHMVPSGEASDEMVNVIQNALETHRDIFSLYMYSMTGSHISSVPLTETAYGGREAKYIVHYKFVGSSTDEVKIPLQEMSIALSEAGLPCKGFYNYVNREFPCAAASGDLWLEAHFSDVSRMRAIKQSEDPNDRFMSALKATMWRNDTNQRTYVGWPNVGDWGGTCTCPDGAVYQVGDNNDGCQSLACVGGVSGSCSENNPGGAGYRVVCGGAEAATTGPSLALTTEETFAPTYEPTSALTTDATSAPTYNDATLAPTSEPTLAPSSAPITPAPVKLAPGESSGSVATPAPSTMPVRHVATPEPSIDLSITSRPSTITTALFSTSNASSMQVSSIFVVACTVLFAVMA